MKYIAEPYQRHGTKHIQMYPGTGLFMEMGLGKTVCTLTAYIEMKARKEVRRAIVIAPLAVAEDVWSDEITKWDHTRHLRISKILGTQRQREKAAMADADIYTINCENVPWLIATFGDRWKWDWVILDELSKFKSPKSIRFKAMRMQRPRVKKITGLTGTPRPNGLIDLWSQLFLLDGGERLGKTIGQYRSMYFQPDKVNGHVVYSYKIKKEEKGSLLGEEIYAEVIYDKISDICISMKTTDYIKLPEKIVRERAISLPPEVIAQYKEFEEELIMEMADDEITAANAAVLAGKLLQFAGGAVYGDPNDDGVKKWHRFHDAKLDALEDIIDDAQGAPVLVFYNYKHELERIMERLKKYKPVLLNKDAKARARWNEGKIRVGLAHARSLGHGVNLQAGGNIIVWFGPQWSLESDQQANARLHRRGQVKPVIVHYLVAKGTMDREVMRALERKATGQNALMKAVKARIIEYRESLIAA